MRSLNTIGYEGAALEGFLAALREAGVSLVLDVREIAASRRKGFAKTALREALAGEGIGYRHEPRLGTPGELRKRVRADGDHERFFADFERHLAGQAPLLGQLAAELEGDVALLCYERDVNFCHRRSVAAALGRLTGLEPRHLTPAR